MKEARCDSGKKSSSETSVRTVKDNIMMNRTKLAAEQAKWAATVVWVELWYTLVSERLQYCENLRMLRELH
jgi:hypothetical protein